MFLNNIPIFYDNASVINITKNPVQHSRTKYIEIRYHFIRDHVLKNDISIEFVDSLNQLADIFTKLLNEAQLLKLKENLACLMRMILEFAEVDMMIVHFLLFESCFTVFDSNPFDLDSNP